MMIGVTEGRVVDVKGDEYAHNRGRLCIKGLMNREILYGEGRALYPMIRKNGKLERATWDEAMDLVATRFREAIDEYGPDSVAFYGSGQLYTQESYTANKLFKAGIGTNNLDGNPRLCMASAVTGYTSSFGKDEPAGSFEDMDYSDCFFIMGSNTLGNRNFKRPFSSNKKVAKPSPEGKQQSPPSEMREFTLGAGSDQLIFLGLGQPVASWWRVRAGTGQRGSVGSRN